VPWETSDAFLSHLFCLCSNIEKNAELLQAEGILLRQVEQADLTDKDMDDYMSSLESLLDRKQEMIVQLQAKVVAYEEAKNS
jgi:hypothetical protein